MRQAAIKGLLITILMLAAVGAVVAAPNSEAGTLLPAIVGFSADASGVSYADVEAGTAQVTLSWNTVNTTGDHRIVLENYHMNYWVSLAADGEVLPLSGSRTITVALPENFGVPTYRLTLKTSRGDVIEQQFVTLAYDAAAQPAPSIGAFTTAVQAVDTNLLVQSNTRIVVSYQVLNRQPDTLIRFEQVLPDGSTVAADLPRRVLWVPSSGNGVVVPRATPSRDDLHFRMSLVNTRDGSVYDQADLFVPVTGAVLIAPSNQQVSAGGGQTDTTAALTDGGQINAFAAESGSAAPDGNVVLNWDAGDAASVQLLAEAEGGPTTLYIELPPAGTMTVPVSPDAPEVTYTLRAEGADGTITTGEVNVAPAGEQPGAGG